MIAKIWITAIALWLALGAMGAWAQWGGTPSGPGNVPAPTPTAPLPSKQCDAAIEDLFAVLGKHPDPAVASRCADVVEWACGTCNGFGCNRPTAAIADCNAIVERVERLSFERIIYHSQPKDGAHSIDISFDPRIAGNIYNLRDYDVRISISGDPPLDEARLSDPCDKTFLPCRVKIIKQSESDFGAIGCLKGNNFQNVDGTEFRLSDYVTGLKPGAARDGDYSKVKCRVIASEPFFMTLTPIRKGGEL